MHKLVTLIVILTVATVGSPARAETPSVEKTVEQPVAQAVTIRQQARRSETAWQEERNRLLDEVAHLQKENDALTEGNTRLVDEKNKAAARIAEKATQLAHMEQIAAQIDPFLNKVLARMRRLIATDLPFLTAERQQRVANLERLLADPAVSQSERLRKLLEALMVELEYGQTIETSRQTIDIAGETTLVDIFRLGRLALFYQHLDGGDCGFYNIAESAWQPLPSRYQGAILAAMEMGAKQRPVDILNLPIGRIEIEK